MLISKLPRNVLNLMTWTRRRTGRMPRRTLSVFRYGVSSMRPRGLNIRLATSNELKGRAEARRAAPSFDMESDAYADTNTAPRY